MPVMRALPIGMRRRANRPTTRKAVARITVAVGAATALLWPQPAGAQDHRDLFWATTASSWHVAHCVQGTVEGWNSNYVLCRVVWPDGSYRYVTGLWVDPWCEITVEPGDMAGTPLRARVRSNQPTGACAPGAGAYPWVDSWYATATEGYVFPRSAADPWARSTVVEIR